MVEPVVEPVVEQAEQPADSHLKVIEEGIMGQIPPEASEMLSDIVLSGKQILYDPKTRNTVMDGFKEIEDDSDPRKVAIGVAGILTLINRKSEKIPVELMIPAGALIGCEVVRFLQEAEMLQLNAAFTGNMVEELLAVLMQKMNMGPKQSQQQPQQPQQQPNEIPGGVSPSEREVPRGIINSAGAV